MDGSNILGGVDIRVRRWNQNNQNGKYAIPYSKRRLPLVHYLFYISRTYDKLHEQTKRTFLCRPMLPLSLKSKLDTLSNYKQSQSHVTVLTRQLFSTKTKVWSKFNYTVI